MSKKGEQNLRFGKPSILCLIIGLLSNLAVQDVDASDKFFGGSLGYHFQQRTDGNSLVVIELVTGWVLGQGPCGPTCSRADIGRSTRSTRPTVETFHSFGRFSLEYERRNGSIALIDISARVNKTYNETVISVDELKHWEQEIMHFSVMMEKDLQEIDISYDGYSWKNLSLQANNSNIEWHLQTKVSSKIRSDTNTTNNSPRSYSRPFYRVKLDEVSNIRIPVVDHDGDFIKCKISMLVEGGIISLYPPPNVNVHPNCTISINASMSAGYTDNSWIAVPVSIRDYNREDMRYGENLVHAGRYSLSTTSVQFAIQVLENLVVPSFVEPTLEFNHMFIIYVGSTWSTDIYAEAPENTTIEEFKAFGMKKEKVILQSLRQDLKRPQIRFTKITWRPTIDDIGDHVICVGVRDNSGVDSEEDMCFSLEVRQNVYNYTSNYTLGKPYFVDIPSPDQKINCKIQSSCILPLYVKSAVKITDIHMSEIFIDKYQVGRVQTTTYKGEQVYRTDLLIEPSMLGDKKICLLAKDVNGVKSETTCITVHIESTDICLSAPCKNAGTCVTDKDTGDFNCLCHPRSSGRFCEFRENPCQPNPCNNQGACYSIGKCYCPPSSGFYGNKCERNINDCKLNACNGHGICKDGIKSYTCECFDRYFGQDCASDKCPAEGDKFMGCINAGCTSDSCSGRGLCSSGGHCTCPYGYHGHQCETPKCDITRVSIGIISPSAKDGSKLICYSQGGMILSCSYRVYITGKSGSVPTIAIETSRDLQNITTVEPAKKSPVLPGVSTVYSADIAINGTFNSTNFQYVCLVATYRASKSSVCYDVKVVTNPEADQGSNAYLRRNAKIKFLQPTLNDRSRIICSTWERCQILFYTSIASNRTSCQATSVVTLSGSVNGSCDIDDNDNDEHDTNVAAKVDSPCCENVISPSAEVKVFPAHPRGPSCVTEVSAIFDSVGEKELCFQSASVSSESQQLCYKVFVYSNDKQDPCLSSPCQNNGHCFRTDRGNFRCVCPDNYEGDACQRGPCQPMDNNCQNDAYCEVYNGVTTCICKAGYLGSTCSKGPSSSLVTFSSKPTSLSCVIYQTCSFSLLLNGQPGHIPTVSPGYVDTTLLLDEIKTLQRKSPGSFQTDIILKALELGEKIVCLQTKNTNGVNQDELCIEVDVVSVSDVNLYSFKNRPYFIEPSLPNNAEIHCLSGIPCHVLYQATPGTGNENECLSFQTQAPAGVSNYHLYSSCENCIRGVSNISNCSIDFSLINNITDNNTSRMFCISVGLKSSLMEGEKRCFNIHIEDANTVVKKGCQMLECRNGGFCDGHDPVNPVCFCLKGFSGRNCEIAKVDRPVPRNQTQSLIGDLAVPSEITCVTRKTCGMSFQIVSETGIIPKVSLGYNNPSLNLGLSSVKALRDSTTVYEGQVVALPDAVGNFKFCLQVILTSETEDEMCINVTVLSTAVEKINQYFPYFLPPTMSSDAMVMCTTGKQCHFDMHFTSGDQFGYAGRCPVMTITSRNLADSVHALDIKRQNTECNADVVMSTPLKVGKYLLCLQVSLPGKKGETRCYIVKVVTDITEGVVSPCLGKSCFNNGRCVADFNSTPPKTSCVCKPGFSGPSCQTDEVTNSTSSICFSCEDLLEPSFCASIERCHSSQICFVESYTSNTGRTHYRSGCKDRQICNQHSVTFSGTTNCLQCCEKSFCNSQGCGGTAMPPQNTRGPLCLDCARVRDPIDCDQIAFCSSGESCSIEKLKWGNEHIYLLGCESTPRCSFEASSRAINERSFETRSVPVCHACCHDDFCNRNCTKQFTDNQQIIIG